MKHIIFALVFIMTFLEINVTYALQIADDSKVIVMNFGTLNNSQIIGLNLQETEKALYDYVVQNLTDSKHFFIEELPEEELKAKNINTVGIINPNDAKMIGNITNADYIVYGRILNITASETGAKILESGLSVYEVQAQISIRMASTKDGNIVGMAKGTGKSKSALVKAGTAEIGTLTVGTKQITQDSVTQSLKKAAEQGVSELIKFLFEKK